MDDGSTYISVKDLVCEYDPDDGPVLRGVTFDISPGEVVALMGENGAGKTTIICHLIGMFVPQRGDVRVFGLLPYRYPERVLARIGYLSEDRSGFDWMTTDDLMWFLSAFYPTWDMEYANTLIDAYRIPRANALGDLSRGQRAQVGLVAAVAHHPDLLVLDEPSAGIDAVARRDILSEVMRNAAEQGRAVLFSSHLLNEVEEVADRVLLLRDGMIQIDEPLATLLERFRVYTAEPDTTWTELPDGVIAFPSSRGPAFLAANHQTDAASRLKAQGISVAGERTPTLEETFFALFRTPWGSA